MFTNPLEILQARELLEILPEGAVMLDRQGIIVAANTWTEKIFGRKPDQLIGKPIQILLPNNSEFFELPLDEERLRVMKEIMLDVGKRKDGREIPLDVRMSSLEVEGELFVLATVRDISRMAALSTKLKDTEHQYRVIIDSLAEGIVVQNAKTEIVNSNHRAEEILGLTKEQIMGRINADPRWKVIHEDGTPLPGEALPAMVMLKTGERIRNAIMGIHKPDGTLTWISINTEPLHEMDWGQPTGVVASFTDVTDQVAAKQQLEKQLRWMTIRSLISAEIAKRNDLKSICDVVLNHLKDSIGYEIGGVGIYDEDMTKLEIVSVYPDDHPIVADLDVSKLGEVSADSGILPHLELYKTNIVPLKDIPISSEDPIHAFIVDKLTENQISVMVFRPLVIEDRVKGIIVLTFKERDTLDEYENAFLNGVASDISVACMKEGMFRELQQSYKQLQEAQNILLEQERLNAMGQMASGIAHDINNTLAPIVLYTEALLESEKDLSERAIRFLKTIQNATKDIERTIGRLRLFYRKPDVKATDREAIDLTQLFDNIINITRPRWQDQHQKHGITIELKSELHEGKLTLFAVRSEIREAMVNLVFNAVDSMPAGGMIALRAYEHDQSIVLEVEDTGTGMTEEQKQKCLEPFYTTKGERGTGLGLASVFGTMERNQGRLEIESEEGKGTTVRLIFPIWTASEDEQLSQEASSALPSLRILCIDDDPKLREGLREVLEMDGHDPVVVENGEQGIEAVREAIEGKNDFDVVITDLGMPEMDGWEVAEGIKKLTPDTPVILLSGWGNLMNGDEETSKDVDAILGKPPQMSKIRETLKTILSKRSERSVQDEK